MMTKLRSVLYSFMWVTPFLAFGIGYQLVRTLTHTETILVQNVVGLRLQSAIKILSADQLNVRILAEKEDPDLAPGTILSQTPEHGKLVKPHQSLFLVITKKPLKPRAPQVLGSTCSAAQKKVRQKNLSVRVYPLESSYPKDRCIGQSIAPHKEVPDGQLTLYCSQGATQLRVFPNLKKRSPEEVVSFFGLYDIPVHVQGDQTAQIKEQRPLAGTIIDMSKPLVVEVKTTG